MSEHKIQVTVNGESVSKTVDSRTLLIHFIREHLELTGSHIGCDTTSCGACTLSMNGKPVKSCTVFAVQADGAELQTIEGVAQDGKLHPIQQAFWEKHGLQCGYCTPGMIMTAKSLLSKNPNPTEQQIREGISGNICRCTGYNKIVEAIQSAAESMKAQG